MALSRLKPFLICYFVSLVLVCALVIPDDGYAKTNSSYQDIEMELPKGHQIVSLSSLVCVTEKVCTAKIEVQDQDGAGYSFIAGTDSGVLGTWRNVSLPKLPSGQSVSSITLSQCEIRGLCRASIYVRGSNNKSYGFSAVSRRGLFGEWHGAAQEILGLPAGYRLASEECFSEKECTGRVFDPDATTYSESNFVWASTGFLGE